MGVQLFQLESKFSLDPNVTAEDLTNEALRIVLREYPELSRNDFDLDTEEGQDSVFDYLDIALERYASGTMGFTLTSERPSRDEDGDYLFHRFFNEIRDWVTPGSWFIYSCEGDVYALVFTHHGIVTTNVIPDLSGIPIEEVTA